MHGLEYGLSMCTYTKISMVSFIISVVLYIYILKSLSTAYLSFFVLISLTGS